MWQSLNLILFFAMVAATLACNGSARAQAPQRPSALLCDPAKLAVGAFDDCLRKAQTDAEKALEDALAKVKLAIDERKDLSGQQRALLKRQMGDSNDLWTKFRNHFCQNVAPILAGPKAKIYEESLSCLIDMNKSRQAELAALAMPR